MIRAAALACLLPCGAVAQSYDAMDRAQCEALLDRVDMVQMGGVVEAGVLAPEGGYCRYSGLRLKGPSSFMDYGIDAAWVRIGGAGRLEHGLPPESLDLRIEGAFIQYLMPDNPVVAWQTTEMMRADGGVALVVRAHWDRAASELVIEEASADFPWQNAIRLSGVIGGVDLSDAMTLERLPFEAGVRRLELEMVSHGLFESLALGPFAVLLSPEEDPAAQVEALKRQARSFVASAPEAVLDGQGRATLDALLADMPHPAGRIGLRVEAEEPFGMARVMPLAMGAAPAAIWDALRGLRIAVDYAPD